MASRAERLDFSSSAIILFDKFDILYYLSMTDIYEYLWIYGKFKYGTKQITTKYLNTIFKDLS